jgi:DNA-binding MarR family transcriptional regulator
LAILNVVYIFPKILYFQQFSKFQGDRPGQPHSPNTAARRARSTERVREISLSLASHALKTPSRPIRFTLHSQKKNNCRYKQLAYLCTRSVSDMKLEDELKQTKPFKSEYQKLVLNIAVTQSHLNSLFAETLKPYDISPPQYNVLRILRGRSPEGYCNQEIAGRMIDKSSNVTRIVDKLLKKKWVTRKENKTDRRLVDIRISDTGIKLLEELQKFTAGDNRLPQILSEEKARQMNEWLDEIRG